VTVSASRKLREAGSPKPVYRRLGRRLSTTHILISVVVILAFVLNLLVLRDRGSTVLVAVADQPIVAGSALDVSALRLEPVASDFGGLATLIESDQLEAFQGWTLGRSLPEGTPVDLASLVEPAAGPQLRSMSLPIAVEHAAGGTLAVGDRIDVISVTDGVASYVALGLEVTSVADRDAGGIGASSGYHVVVAVDEGEALDLATALAGESMELVRSSGSSTPRGDDG